MPVADADEDDHREEGDSREPADARLAAGDDDKRGEDRPERGADIAADLKQGLREAVASARGHPRDPRGFRVEHRRPGAHHRRGEQQHEVAAGVCQQQQADQRHPHPDRQRIGLRAPIGEEPHRRLQERGDRLHRQGDQPDLRKAETVRTFQDRIDRRNQRLHRVVEEVGKLSATRIENIVTSAPRRATLCSPETLVLIKPTPAPAPHFRITCNRRRLALLRCAFKRWQPFDAIGRSFEPRTRPQRGRRVAPTPTLPRKQGREFGFAAAG